jgi:hypothetical protein
MAWQEGADDEDEAAPDDDGADADEEEVDIFAEVGLDVAASGGMDGEELLCTRYMQTNVHEAQQEAAQLQASMRLDDDRRRAAADDAAQRPTDLTARKRHHPDEPLQRPTTPGAPDAPQPDYGELAMQQSGALAEAMDDGGEGTQPPAGDDDAEPPPPISYPDPDAVDSTSPTIPVRNRLARTPSRKVREGGEKPAPLQPTAPRARATVERVQRKGPPAGPPAGGTMGASGGSATSPNAAPSSRSKGGAPPPAE